MMMMMMDIPYCKRIKGDDNILPSIYAKETTDMYTPYLSCSDTDATEK